VPHPVTYDELNRLRKTWKDNPNDDATGLRLAKKLVEAASILADENGTADKRTRDKNKEKFVLEAHKIVKKLAQHQYGEAMFYLADCYGQGQLGLQADTKEAFTLYQGAAKAGHAASAYRTAVCCEMGHEEGGGTKRDPLKAVQWYRRAAALGDTPALYKMGMILLKGLLGQQKNQGEAINMLQRAANQADRDNPHALHELALIYEQPASGNERVIPDEAYALQLFMQAADLGYKFSQFRLGQAYEYGLLGCPIDPRKSIGWYTKAAAQEEHQSELALSGWYLTGIEGVLQQSDTEAYLWARKAACAEPPLPKALFAMGYFTEVGIGCPKSLEEAKRWYGRAAGKSSMWFNKWTRTNV
jgi:TPR repeat protein